MKYQNKYYRDGMLLVEKYSGMVELEDILQNEREIFSMERDTSKQMLALSDISKAELKNLGYDQIVRLFEIIDAHSLDTNGMKIALYTGNMRFEDFQKAYKYVEQASNRPLSLISFNFIDMAMDWLGLTDAEKKDITLFLNENP